MTVRRRWSGDLVVVEEIGSSHFCVLDTVHECHCDVIHL